MISTPVLRALTVATTLFMVCSAQVTTSCNPLKGTCPNDKGLAASTYSIDFSTLKTLPPEWTLADYTNVALGPQGAELTFAKRYDAPTMWTNFKFFFGRVEFVVKAAPGTGIVSSMVLLSADLDEIDWEFLGGATSTVQTNYFGKGYTGSYNRSTTPVVANPQSTFYTYTLDWSPTALVWSIDGTAVRTLNAADADGNGSQYPQSPMKVSLSLWDAGDPDAATQGWGGGVTPIPPPEPYTMYVKSVKIWNTNPAEQYQFMDQSGSYKSIKIINDKLESSSSSLISTQATETLSLGSTSMVSSRGTSMVSSSSSNRVDSISSSLTSAVGGVTSSPSIQASTTHSGISATSTSRISRSDTGIWSWTSTSPTSAPSPQSSKTPEKQTIYSTMMVTITSCHLTVKSCPASTSPYVTTSLVPVTLMHSNGMHTSVPLSSHAPVPVSSTSPNNMHSTTSLSLHIPVPLTSEISNGIMSTSSHSSAVVSCSCTPPVTSYITITAASHMSTQSSDAIILNSPSSRVTFATGSSISPAVGMGSGSASASFNVVDATMFSTGSSRTMTTMAPPGSSSVSDTMSQSPHTRTSITQSHFRGSSSMVVATPSLSSWPSIMATSMSQSHSSSSDAGIPISGHGIKSPLSGPTSSTQIAATVTATAINISQVGPSSKAVPSPHSSTHASPSASTSPLSLTSSLMSTHKGSSTTVTSPASDSITTNAPISSLPNTGAYWSSMSAAYGSSSLSASLSSGTSSSPSSISSNPATSRLSSQNNQIVAAVQMTPVTSLPSPSASGQAQTRGDDKTGFVTHSGPMGSMASNPASMGSMMPSSSPNTTPDTTPIAMSAHNEAWTTPSGEAGVTPSYTPGVGMPGAGGNGTGMAMGNGTVPFRGEGSRMVEGCFGGMGWGLIMAVALGVVMGV